MAYGFGVSASGGTVGGTANIYTLALAAVTAGSTIKLFASFASQNRDILTVSDSVDGAWSSREVVGGIASTGMGTYRKENVSASARTITVTFDSTAVSAVILFAVECTGLLTPASFDVASALATTASGASLSTGSITTGFANELLFAFARSESIARPLTLPAGYTSLISLDSGAFVVAHNRQTVAGSQSTTWGVTGGNSAIGAVLTTYQEASASTLEPPARRFAETEIGRRGATFSGFGIGQSGAVVSRRKAA